MIIWAKTAPSKDISSFTSGIYVKAKYLSQPTETQVKMYSNNFQNHFGT